MIEFVAGEVLTVTISGARVIAYHTDPGRQARLVFVPSGSNDAMAIAYPWDGVEIERVAPPEWPPQPGDVWIGQNGVTWFGRDTADYEENEPVTVKLTSSDDYGFGGDRDPDAVNRDYGPLRLAFRPEPTAEQDGADRS